MSHDHVGRRRPFVTLRRDGRSHAAPCLKISRRSVRTAAATLFAVAAVLGSGLAGAPSWQPARAATPGDYPARVSITRITPQVPRPGDTLTLRGSLTGGGVTTYDSVTVRLRVSRNALVSRTEVAEVADGTPGLRDGLPVAGTEQVVATSLAPGARADWVISIPVDDLSLPRNGVFVIGVEARGSTGGGSSTPERIGLRKTFLPWMPQPAQLAPTRLTWLWPLTDRPSRDTSGAFTSQRAAAQLAEATAAGGRLDTLVSAPGSMPVTWLVDPDLLESVAALGAEHRIRSGKRSRTAPPDPVARRWWQGLRQGLIGKPVAALPYADPDLAALRRNGQAVRIGHALARGSAATTALLGRPVGTDLVWPPDGLADAATLATLRRAGVRTVVLDNTVVVPRQELNYTPTGRARVDTPDGPLDVLVADAELTATIAADLADPGTALLAAQHFLADTALITLERPIVARTILVAPPRHWSPPAAWLASLLAETRRAPWLQIVGLDTLQVTPPATGLSDATLVAPLGAAARELPARHIASVRRVARDAGRVTSVLTQPEAVTELYDAALLRAQSSSWRGDQAATAAYLAMLRGDVLADLSKVRVIGRDLVTLSSKSGTIPVTVTNELTQPVRIRLSLAPKVPSRLRVATPDAIRIGAGRKTTIKVPAVAYANGLTVLDVQLLTPDGQAYGPATSLRVNATNYGNLGLVVVVGAGVLLLVAAGLRNVVRLRRARARRRGGGGPSIDQPIGATRADEKVQT